MKYKLFCLFLGILLLTGCTLSSDDSESSEFNEDYVNDLISTDETKVWFSGEKESPFTQDLDTQGIYPDFKINHIFVQQNQEIIAFYDCENLHISDLKTLDTDQIIDSLKKEEIDGISVQYNSDWKYPATFEITSDYLLDIPFLNDDVFTLSLDSNGNDIILWDLVSEKLGIEFTNTNEVKNYQSFIINENNNFTKLPIKGFLTNISTKSQNSQNENNNLSQYLFFLE